MATCVDVENDVLWCRMLPGRETTQVQGKFRCRLDSTVVEYVAARPVDRRDSVSGSGMPFADLRQAFERTPNTGRTTVRPDGSFALSIRTPAAYYASLGTVLVPPMLFLTYHAGGTRNATHVQVGDPVPFRMLTYPSQFTRPRRSPEFYAPDRPAVARSQEAILRASAYPSVDRMPADFWGGKPPC